MLLGYQLAGKAYSSCIAHSIPDRLRVVKRPSRTQTCKPVAVRQVNVDHSAPPAVTWLLHIAGNRLNQALRRLHVVEKNLDNAARDTAGKSNTTSENSPANQVAIRELIELVCVRLSPDEREIKECYGRGDCPRLSPRPWA